MKNKRQKYYFNIPKSSGMVVGPGDHEYTKLFKNEDEAYEFFDKKCYEHKVGPWRYLAYWCLEKDKEKAEEAIANDDGV